MNDIDNNLLTLLFGIWSILMTIIMAGIGWLVNRIFKMLDDLRAEDALIRGDITNNYVRRDDYMRFQTQIIEFLRRIEDKLDKKQDKYGR